MASTNTNTTLELLQLLTALGVQIDHDPALARLSPAFLEARLQTYLGFAQREVLKPGQSKLEIGGEVEDVGKVSLKEYEMGPLHGGHDHGHGHSHDGNDHGHSHDGNDHGHDHSHGAHAGAPAHSHSHGENDHGHSHGGGAAAAVGDHGHGHTHDGEPCGGHDDEGGDEEDDEEEGDPSGEQINQVLRALRHYLSALTQGILQAWSRPPLFPGAPRHNMWVLREPTRDGKPSPTNLGHDLVLTIAGAATIPSPTTTSSSTSSTSPPEEGVEEAEEEAQPPTPVILLHYAHDSPAARKGLWGNTMQMNLPREILHLLSVLLDSNSKKCPSFRAVPEAQVGLASNGFKPSFLVPVSEAHPDEDKIGKLDLKKEVFGKLVECDVCGLLGPDLKCAKCKGRTYCSAGCQRKDWKEHKGNCAK